MLLYSHRCAVGWLTGSKGACRRLSRLQPRCGHGAERLKARCRGGSGLRGAAGNPGPLLPLLPALLWGRLIRSLLNARLTAKILPTWMTNLDQMDYREQIWRYRKRLHVSVLLAWQKAPGTALVSIGLAVDGLSLSSPNIQVSIGSARC